VDPGTGEEAVEKIKIPARNENENVIPLPSSPYSVTIQTEKLKYLRNKEKMKTWKSLVSSILGDSSASEFRRRGITQNRE
jgi:hypothetical protein